MTRILTLALLTLTTACSPSNEEVFIREAAKVACSCYATDAENTQCVEDLEPAFEQSLETGECSSLYRRDEQLSPENTEYCITVLKSEAAGLDGYCRTEEYLNIHPEEDCEDVLTEFVFEDSENPDFCDEFEFEGPWYHETLNLREQCPDLCKN